MQATGTGFLQLLLHLVLCLSLVLHSSIQHLLGILAAHLVLLLLLLLLVLFLLVLLLLLLLLLLLVFAIASVVALEFIDRDKR